MSDERRARWRLVLGRYAKRHLPDDVLSATDARAGRALDYLYGREGAGRGELQAVGADGRGGGLEPSALTIPRWIAEVRDLFPTDTVQRIQQHALERYRLTGLLDDPETLRDVRPSVELLQTLLALKDHAKPAVLAQIRRLVDRVVEELTERLSREVRQAFSGRIDRFRKSPLKVAQNFDAHRTIRENLRRWDPETQRLLVEAPRFFARVRRELPWHVILCVDQSGSMAPSIIYAAVMAGIFAKLPALRVKLVLFDTSVVDLSEQVDDPTSVILGVQLGGGTNIGQALRYCETLVEDPRRTVLVLVSDFEEGGSPRTLLTLTARLASEGVRLLGLAALDEEGTPFFDHGMAERLAAVGMEVAAITPRQLGRWLAEVVR
ncbi:MAG TPA: VWA containing CoxE family protein [Myxococcales bacterium]|nr:VWA containing CoxE family protein [Myxococcales bacterium]